jgi:hypothetical protein
MSRWKERWLLRSELLGTVLALSLCQLGGCAKEREYRVAEDLGEEEEEEEDAGAASEPTDEASTGEPTLRALMTDLFAEYLRDIAARCPCFVSEGLYASVDECMERTTRGPEIDDCLDRTVPEGLLEVLRDWARCLVDAKRVHNACLEEAAACGEQAECRNESSLCSFPDAVRLKSALDQCPGAIGPAR